MFSITVVDGNNAHRAVSVDRVPVVGEEIILSRSSYLSVFEVVCVRHMGEATPTAQNPTLIYVKFKFYLNMDTPYRTDKRN